jgi:hypothetical protein
MEIAFDARALSISCLCNSQLLPTAMSAMSILAMAMVICLFGGYIDFPDESRIPPRGGPPLTPSFPSQKGRKENMNPQPGAIAAWDFSRWFVLLSPVIGILSGLFGAFLVLH